MKGLPDLQKRSPTIYAWAIEASLRGMSDADVAVGIDTATGLRYNPGTLGKWRRLEGVMLGGDRRRPIPPLPVPGAAVVSGATVGPNATDAERIISLTGKMAGYMGGVAPGSYADAERVVAEQRIVGDAEVLVSSSDWQGMWVDPVAMRTRANIIRTFQPNINAVLGDGFDFYAVSRFNKSPELMDLMDPADERDLINTYLDQDAKLAPSARLWWKDGNHEAHLEKYIGTNAPNVARLGKSALTVPEMLKLDDRRAEYRRYTGANSRPFDFHGLQMQHGTFASKIVGGNSNTAKAMRQWPGSSGVIGHSHRAEVSYHMSRGQLWQWWNQGCLCYTTPGMEYIEGSPDNWAQCVLVAWYVDGRLHVQLGIMQDHCTVIGGWYFTPDGAYRL